MKEHFRIKMNFEGLPLTVRVVIVIMHLHFPFDKINFYIPYIETWDSDESDSNDSSLG